MKKIPYGIINYETLIKEDYIYVDKTKYLEKIEQSDILPPLIEVGASSWGLTHLDGSRSSNLMITA